MSLKVWLPLDGDLRNLGTSPDTFSGSPTYAQGKIGQCMVCPATVLTTKSDLPAQLTKNNVYSLCCWLKMANPSEGSGWLILLGSGTGTTRGLWISSTVQWAYSGSGQNFQVSIHPNDGNWHHIATTIDGSVAKLYIDGQFMSSLTPTTLEPISNKNIQIGTPSRSFHINDARIYDHCLSAAEVHEIAQGLILHYKLDNNGMGNPNLALNSKTFKNWIAGSGWQKITEDNETIYHFSRSGATANNWMRLIPETTIIPSNYPNGITVSLDFKTEDVSAINHTCIGAIQIYQPNGTRIGWIEPKWDLSQVENNKWIRLSQFFSSGQLAYVNPTYEGATVAYTRFSFQLEQNGSIYIKNVKIENGNKATAYFPSPEELNIDMTHITDSSGYGYTGNIISNTTITSDSPRYETSTYFTNNTGGIEIPNMPMHIFNNGNTIAFWIKPSNENGDRSIYCSSFSGTAYAIEKNTSNKLRVYWAGSPDKSVSSFAINDNEWQHIAIVKLENKTEIKVYKNGTLIETLTGAFDDKAWSGTYRIGRDSRTDTTSYIGQMSDFRIYCTSLLDNDIKLLYNTNMRLDNFNNIHVYEINENDTFAPKLLKTGILKGKTFIENCMAEMPDGDSISFTPAANQDNRNSSTIGILFPYFKHCGHKLRVTVELDATWTKFTAGTGGTFALFFQGPRKNIDTDVVEWAGQAMVTGFLPRLTSKVLEGAGSEHIKVTGDINSSFFDTHYGQAIGLRCNFSDGTGHIDINNVKVYIDYPSAKIHSKYIEENSIIEM